MLHLSDDNEIFRGYTTIIELYNALKIITLLFFIQKILTFNLGVAFLKSVSICGALSFLLDNIYIRFGTRLYRQIVGILMGTNCAPLVSDLFLFYFERDFMKNLFSDNQADVIKAFNLTSRYLDDLLNIDNPYFEGMVNQIYPPELQLDKANTSYTEALFLDLHLSISNGFV